MATGQTLKLLVLSTLLAGTLAGCLSAGSAQAPEGVRMDGPWKLDHNVSDDPQKEIDKLRQYAAKMARRRVTMGQPDPAPHEGGRGGRGQPRSQDPQQLPDDQTLSPRPGAADILTNSQAMHELMAFLQRGDYLTVRQDPEHFELQYGSTGRSFTPGAKSVVSAETGVADQVSGWKGKVYVIDVRPQVGPSITEEYSLSEDQKHLVVKLHVGSSELPAVDLKQVFARVPEVGPRALPTND
jgi:hypothetical protein